jgi:hypothetical protein
LANGKGPTTNNEKKKRKSFIKTFLSSLINHAPLWRNGKGLTMMRRIIIFFIIIIKTHLLIYPIDQNLDNEKGTMMRRIFFKKNL